MNKNIKFSLLSLALLVFTLSGCEKLETAEPISPSGYPVATITSDATSDVLKEGDIVTYTIKLDKMLDHDITFSFQLDDASSVDASDLEVSGDGEATIPAYSTDAQMIVKVLMDNVPEQEDESLIFELSVVGLDYRYTLKPETSKLSQSFTVKNINDPSLLTVMFGWNTEEDIDMVTFSDTPTNPLTPWGDGGATGANPETDTSIWLADPVGSYYVNIMDWGVDSFNYTFTIGYPDQTIQVIEGTFDRANFVNDPWTAWGGSYDSYRVLEVNNDGTTFTVLEL